MAQQINEHGQPVGAAIEEWVACPRPPQTPLLGTFAEVLPLSAETHGDDLFAAFGTDPSGAMWTYMPSGPFFDRQVFGDFLRQCEASTDPLFYVIINNTTGRAEGFASFLRIEPTVGVIEVGYIAMSPPLQKTRVATEAMYLMMAHVFDDLGYRRYEWKCDNLNGPSKKAARRLGFAYDGMFPQATIYKGRNRDTAWFSVLDKDWPAIQSGFQTWLNPENFDDDGLQKSALVTRGI